MRYHTYSRPFIIRGFHYLSGFFNAFFRIGLYSLLSLRLLTGYKMYPGVEFSCTSLAGIVCQSYQFFYFFIEVPLRQNNHTAHILLYTYGRFFKAQLDHFVPMEGAPFVQQLRTEKTDWICCQCSEWVYKDHSIKTIQIKCDNCKEQSY